jgi:hypothetical protein
MEPLRSCRSSTKSKTNNRWFLPPLHLARKGTGFRATLPYSANLPKLQNNRSVLVQKRDQSRHRISTRTSNNFERVTKFDLATCIFLVFVAKSRATCILARHWRPNCHRSFVRFPAINYNLNSGRFSMEVLIVDEFGTN